MRLFESAGGDVLIDGRETGAVVRVVTDGRPNPGELSPEECGDAGRSLIEHAAYLYKKQEARGS